MKLGNTAKIAIVIATLFVISVAGTAKASVSLNAQPTKPNTVIVMLEDGWLDQYQNAVPILDKFGFKASFDVYTNGLDTGSSKGYMDWNNIEALYKAGHDVQSHTIHHYNLNQLSNKSLTNEVSYSKTIFLMHGIQVGEVALPYDVGQNNATVVQAVKAAGYSLMRSNNELVAVNNGSKLNVNLYFMNSKTPTDFLNQNLNGSISVLIYHHIANDPKDTTAVSPANFTAQMQLLKDNGYNVQTLSQAFLTVTPYEGDVPTSTPYPLFDNVNFVGIAVVIAFVIIVVGLLVALLVRKRRRKNEP
jgi:peptidoglycan/xylan/chitin deacetylase (PgdA/CDA1 family)